MSPNAAHLSLIAASPNDDVFLPGCRTQARPSLGQDVLAPRSPEQALHIFRIRCRHRLQLILRTCSSPCPRCLDGGCMRSLHQAHRRCYAEYDFLLISVAVCDSVTSLKASHRTVWSSVRSPFHSTTRNLPASILGKKRLLRDTPTGGDAMSPREVHLVVCSQEFPPRCRLGIDRLHKNVCTRCCTTCRRLRGDGLDELSDIDFLVRRQKSPAVKGPSAERRAHRPRPFSIGSMSSRRRSA